MSRETAEANERWRSRLELPYLLLSDRDGTVGRTLGAVRVLRIAGWSVELVRRATLMIDARGIVAAVWTRVHIRGHAKEVLDVARASTSGGP